MRSKLSDVLRYASLPAALFATMPMSGADAEQLAETSQREFVSDTTGTATRTTVTGQCLRTGFPNAGAALAGCVETPAAAAKPIPPAAPVQTAKAESPPPLPEFVHEPEPADMVPVPPLEPIADDDDRISAPVWYYDEEPRTTPETIVGRTYNPDYAEELAAAEAEMAAAEAPPPPAPSAPPEPSVAPPPPPPQPEVRRLRLATDTYFHFDRAQLTSAGRAELDKLVAEMGSANISAISIVGYADRIGSDAYNLKLSQRRADAVRQYLAERQVAANRMRAIGRGKSDPVTASGACKGLASKRLIQCLAPDRRVEIEVVGLAAPAR